MIARFSLRRHPPPQEESRSFEWFTLKFRDDGQESGFVKASNSKLIANVRTGCGVCVVGLSLLLLMFRAWDVSPDRYRTAQQMEIHQFTHLMHFVMWLYSILLICITSPLVVHRMQPAMLEAVVVFFVCSSMAIFVLASPHYAGRVLDINLDTSQHLEASELSDTLMVLGLDGFITASHILFPIRFRMMLFIQVSGILCYLLPAAILRSPNPENVPQTLVTFCMLILISGFGKHSLEREERTQFLELIHEKRLRVQSEFQLAAYEEQRRNGGTPEDAVHVQGLDPDVQSTSKGSTPGFTLDGLGGLSGDALVQLGLQEQWLIREQEVQLLGGSPLGEGGFAVVARGRYYGAQVAVKAPKAAALGASSKTDGFLEASCNELRILRRLRHPNIVALYGAVLQSASDRLRLCLVLELIKGESLKQFIAPGPRSSALLPPEAMRVRALADVAAALCYLHSRQPVVVHGDLKVTNIYVDRRGDHAVQAKLLDFGLARLVKVSARSMGGTLRWAAPEVLSGRHAPSTPTDVFSFGRIVFYVSTGQVPFSHVSDRQLRRHLSHSPSLRWPAEQPAGDVLRQCQGMAEECARLRPELRPRAGDIYPLLLSVAEQAAATQVCQTASSGPLPAPSLHDVQVFDGFDFATEAPSSTTMSSSRLQLSTVPEGEPLRAPGQLAHGSFHPTPHGTLMKAVSFILMQSNHEVGAEGSCCWVHAGLERLRAVCRDLQEMPCDGWSVPVDGQCEDCQLLSVGGGGEAAKVCSFCRGRIVDPRNFVPRVARPSCGVEAV